MGATAATIDKSKFVYSSAASGATPNKITLAADTTKYLNNGSGYKPGTYTVQVTVTMTGTSMTTAPTHTVTLKFKVEEMCDPPTSLTASSLAAFNYVIGADGSKSKEFTAFTVVPSFCPITYTSSVSPTKVNTSDIAVALDGTNFRKFSINYSKSTVPADSN